MYLSEEFQKIWKKIENNENVSILRYGDGERAIMTGKKVVAQEGWVSPNYVSNLGKALISTLSLTGDNLFHGISCPCCDQSAFYWYKTRIENQNITFANLFININYENFLQKFSELNRDAVFIGNYKAINKRIGNLNFLESYFVSDDCFTFFENDLPKMIESIKLKFLSKNNLLFVIAAGPLSEVIISELYKENPNNSYIDFGSSLDEYIHSSKTRPYMNSSSKYAKSNCFIPDIPREKLNISVVLNAYKRIDYLSKQLESIKNQTIKPKEILLFQDKIEDDKCIVIPDVLLSEFDNVFISDKNVGCWGRFEFAKEASCDYICLFDDDTIPGESWLENCYIEMQKQEGLYGTIGIIMKEPRNYPNKKMLRIGWDSANRKTTKVDFVGHSWFLKKKWLCDFFGWTKDFQKFKTAGEDMCLSAHLQRKGINTFVPPHHYKKIEMWGSNPELAVLLGTQDVAVSSDSSNIKKMNKSMNMLIDRGFIPLVNVNPIKVKKMILKMKIINFLIRIFPKKIQPRLRKKYRGLVCD